MTEKETTTLLLENLQTKVSDQIYAAYLSDISVFSIEDSCVTITCKNSFTKQTIEGRFFNTIKQALDKILKQNIELTLTIKNTRDYKKAIELKPAPKQLQSRIIDSPTKKNTFTSNLNPKYIFDLFIVGSNNQLAFAAAQAIVDNPGDAYNPFFIYGGVGLGKTHLMQAIGNAILKKQSEAKILYCTTETFLNEMVKSIRDKSTDKFREKYRQIDVLILDDIQFLSKKEGLQEEFYNTFNSLYQSGKQIILASDRPPYEIQSLGDRIRSRFEGGLVADIQAPNFETRLAILENKLKEKKSYLPGGLLQVIAEVIDTNVRELEGALLKIILHYKSNPGLTGKEIRTLLGAKIIDRKKKLTHKDIITEVCNHYDVSYKDIKSSKRNADISLARQISMYLIKEILNPSLKKIAEYVGRTDHTTIIHGINKIERSLNKDSSLSQAIMEIRSKINT